MKKLAVILTAALAATAAPQSAAAQTADRFLGEIIMVGMNFCPRGTMDADGRLLPISQNTALFSLFGTFYGGDGRTTFALPDLRGRVPVGQGSGPGLDPVRQGEKRQTGAPESAEAHSEKDQTFAPLGLGNDKKGSAQIGLRFCVITQGIYPSRS